MSSDSINVYFIECFENKFIRRFLGHLMMMIVNHSQQNYVVNHMVYLHVNYVEKYCGMMSYFGLPLVLAAKRYYCDGVDVLNELV
jgi:hypothetical protein